MCFWIGTKSQNSGSGAGLNFSLSSQEILMIFFMALKQLRI